MDTSAPGAYTTLTRTIQRGEPVGHGADGAYYRLHEGPGEPHVRRLDALPDAPAPNRRRSLLHFAHVTDIHIPDTESPGRFEFVDRFHGPPALHLLLPAYRPQEILQLHACEMTLRTVNALAGSPITGRPIQFLLCTGDHTDNAQVNELQRVLSLWGGGSVALGAAGRGYRGVASPDWGDTAYWHPDKMPDDYKRRWGFPNYPHLLDDVSRPFQAQGVALPWLTCFGNHDALVQGTAVPNDAYERILRGTRKARLLPPDFTLMERLDLFIHRPDAFLAGPAATVADDADRLSYTRGDFVRAWVEAGGAPCGHGFSAANVAAGTAYSVCDDYPPVRLITLDTVNRSGHFQGSIGAAQLAWLEQRLIEVHARYRNGRGRLVETVHEDRLVALCSHHGLASLVNDRSDPDREDDLPRILSADVEALLHRFPNVVLWVSGHIHRNAVRLRPNPFGLSAGFWEVSTSSLIAWPCQARLIELVSNGNGTLSALCTMVDHAAPADPTGGDELLRLAAIHRELAANDPHAGVAGGTQGQPSDRNVELVIPAPFALE